MMNRSARRVRPLEDQITTPGNLVTLRLVNNDTLDNPHCLLYLVPLKAPGIRSTLTRRLRLKDSLAGGSAGHNAGILAKDPHFWEYLQQINLMAYEFEIDIRRARHFINRICNVGSRHELNRNETAARRFFDLIENPFLNWLLAAETI